MKQMTNTELEQIIEYRGGAPLRRVRCYRERLLREPKVDRAAVARCNLVLAFYEETP